jgi:hypothetical protein
MYPGGEVQYPRGHDKPIPSAAWHLLNTVVATYQAAGVELPTRQFVAIGSVAVDEPLLAVMFGGTYTGLPGNELNTPYSNRNNAPRSMTFDVQLWRHIPALTSSGNAPSAQVISEASEIIMHDGWLLLEAAFASDQTYGTGVIANVGVLEPQGEMHGIGMTVEMQVV